MDIDKISDLKPEKDKEDPMMQYNMLDNFYKRYNKVHLDKLAIEK